MLIQIESNQAIGDPLTESQFRALFPNVSFVVPLDVQTVVERGYAFYRDSLAPEVDKYEVVEESVPVQVDESLWEKGWVIRPMTTEEIADVDAYQVQHSRVLRNAHLIRSDWTQFADSPLTKTQKTHWKTYRKQLRDVPAQAGFPWDITWPEEPV